MYLCLNDESMNVDNSYSFSASFTVQSSRALILSCDKAFQIAYGRVPSMTEITLRGAPSVYLHWRHMTLAVK